MPIFSSIRLLSKSKLIRVHEATLQVLDQTGVVFKSEQARNLFQRHGARVDGEVVFLSGDQVEAALESAPPTFQWWARNPSNRLIMGAEQEHPYTSPNQGPIYIQDLDNGRRLGQMIMMGMYASGGTGR